MNTEVKQAWLAALRSGEYEQGRGLLRHPMGDTRGDLFCCLGVLCELHRLTVGGEWEDEFYNGNAETLPSEVSRWAELDEVPIVGDTPIIALNDGRTGLTLPNVRPHSFLEIADLIEAHL